MDNGEFFKNIFLFINKRQDYPFLVQLVSKTTTDSVVSCNLGNCAGVLYGNIDACLS